MRVLVAGDWHSELHEEVVSRALRSLWHEVEEFKWHGNFKRSSGILGGIVSLIRRAQNKYLFGPIVGRINQDLVARALDFRPDMLFVYRGTHITKSTLRTIKTAIPDCVLVGYNNDDPFSPNHDSWLWRIFLRAIPEYDLMLAYRHSNILEYFKAGARRVELLRSWYVPERNHPVPLTEKEKNQFNADVVFVGHYEADQRLEYLEEIVRQGFSLRLYGPDYDWDPVIRSSPILQTLEPIRLVWGEDYNRALCGAKIALCFFSKLNRDTYTRRCFEIPATGTFLLSEYSDDLATLYDEGVEAEFFRNRDEMIKKIHHYLEDDQSRLTVALGGHQRVTNDRHDVIARMEQVIQWVVNIKTGAI